MKPNELIREIIGAAIEVHRELGPGKPEAAYELALAHELVLRGLAHHVQRPVAVVYKGVRLECGYRLDLLVEELVVVEVKAVELVHPVHRAQVLTYLKLGGWKLALLLNFNVVVLREGIERIVLGFDEGAGRKTEILSTHRITLDLDPEYLQRCGLHNRPLHLRSTVDSGDRQAEALAREVIACALDVHREMGVGLLASAYKACLAHELNLRGLPFERQPPLALKYKGISLGESDEIEFVVGERLVVKPHALHALQPLHEAELLSQLRLGGWSLGLLINFNSLSFADGLRRIISRECGR